MKLYQIIVRQSTVTFTISITRSNAKKAKKAALKVYPGFSIYKMHRIG